MNDDQNPNQQTGVCKPAAKWAALINDRLFPMPRRELAGRDILAQAGAPDGTTLVRDHSNQSDVSMPNNELVDLARGNVFRLVPQCQSSSQPSCTAPPKLAFVCDDAWEVTLIGRQSGKSIKGLFSLPEAADLFRDFESPNDEKIGNEATVEFTDGPVFTAKRADVTDYCVNIEGKKYSWSTPTITTADIRKLGNLPSDQQVVCENADGTERTLREDETVKLDPCCQFGRAPKYKRG